MIYFAQGIEGGPIKIGFSRNVWRRISNLQSANHEKLFILGVMEGDRAEEKRIHTLFERVSGEWFRPTPELYEFIRANCEDDLRPNPSWDKDPDLFG